MKLKKPTLLIDKEKCIRNIQKMKAKTDKYKVRFRPHFKTHQSTVVGGWFEEAGVSAITVSSVTMAGYFVSENWEDITIAFPVNLAEIDEINQLANQISLNLLVENTEAIGFLASKLKFKTGIYLKVDSGYHRTGVPVDDHQSILKLILEVQDSPIMQFKGLLVHNGNTYKASSKEEIKNIHRHSIEKLARLKAFLWKHQIYPEISVGDTPAMSVVENFEGIDEIRPGNFVFYDVMQAELGSCTHNDIAVALACPVVAKHPERMEIVIYGGAVHLSKDFITGKDGNPIFGKIVMLNKNGWSDVIPGAYVKSLSQEHGIIKVGTEFFEKGKIGDFIGVLPIHSCLTVNQMREYFICGIGEKSEPPPIKTPGRRGRYKQTKGRNLV